MLRSAWSALPGNVRGGAWMLASALCMAVQGAAIKALGESVDSLQVTFVRCAVGLVLVVPMVRNQLATVFRPARLRLHLGRVTAGLLSMACGFYAFAHMPLAEATALTFTMPLFLLMLATVTLGERVGWRRASAAVVGFGGVLVMLRPGALPVAPAALVALASAFFHAWSGIFIKKLSASESTGMIMFYFAAVGSILFALPAVGVWVAPGPSGWALLAVVAVLGVVSQLAFIEAARAAEMSAIVPIDYSRVLFAGLIGYLVWSELPDAWAVVGASLIAGSTCFISYREIQLARAARRAAGDAPAQPD